MLGLCFYFILTESSGRLFRVLGLVAQWVSRMFLFGSGCSGLGWFYGRAEDTYKAQIL